MKIQLVDKRDGSFLWQGHYNDVPQVGDIVSVDFSENQWLVVSRTFSFVLGEITLDGMPHRSHD